MDVFSAKITQRGASSFSFQLSLFLTSCLLLLGCASIDVVPLQPNGQEDENQEHGVRYYMPQPYLLVAKVPKSQVKNEDGSDHTTDGDKLQAAVNEYQMAAKKEQQAITDADAAHAALSEASEGATTQSTTSQTTLTTQQEKTVAADKLKEQLIAEADASRDRVTQLVIEALGQSPSTGQESAKTNTAPVNQQQGGSTPGTASDTSFSATSDTYVLKLIYLPDKTQPMAIEQKGWFGTSSLKPTLQDGWMLTSLDTSQDSKTAETLSAVASLLSSSTIAGATGGVGGAGKTKQNVASILSNLPENGEGVQVTADSSDVLRPGLYRFIYSKTTGELIGLRRVTFFGPDGVNPYIQSMPSNSNQAPPNAYP